MPTPELKNTPLTKIISRFDKATIDNIYGLNHPTKKFKNLILAFLTLFHSKLDTLVDESSQPDIKKEENSECKDLEWLTIKSFFRNSGKVVNLVKKTEFYLFEGVIDQNSFQNSAKIYQSVLLEPTTSPQGSNISKAEEATMDYLADLLDMFVIYVFDLEREISGDDHLDMFDSNSENSMEKEEQLTEESSEEKKVIEEVIEEVSEDQEYSVVVSERSLKSIQSIEKTDYSTLLEKEESVGIGGDQEEGQKLKDSTGEEVYDDLLDSELEVEFECSPVKKAKSPKNKEETPEMDEEANKQSSKAKKAQKKEYKSPYSQKRTKSTTKSKKKSTIKKPRRSRKLRESTSSVNQQQQVQDSLEFTHLGTKEPLSSKQPHLRAQTSQKGDSLSKNSQPELESLNPTKTIQSIQIEPQEAVKKVDYDSVLSKSSDKLMNKKCERRMQILENMDQETGIQEGAQDKKLFDMKEVEENSGEGEKFKSPEFGGDEIGENDSDHKLKEIKPDVQIFEISKKSKKRKNGKKRKKSKKRAKTDQNEKLLKKLEKIDQSIESLQNSLTKSKELNKRIETNTLLSSLSRN